MPLEIADPRLHTLLEPLGSLLADAVARLGPTPTLRARIADIEGFSLLQGEALLFSAALCGPGPQHPAEDPTLPLDRWRRALACALEGLALAALARRLDRPVEHTWPWLGWAIEAADRAAPGLELARPDLALALRTGDPGRNPRAGVAILRAAGAEAETLALQAAAGALPSPDRWLALAERVDDPEGPAAGLPVQRPPAAPWEASLEPWSWRRVSGLSPRGGVLRVEGEARLREAWVVGGAPFTTLFAATGPARLHLAPGAPLGSFELGSLHGFGRVMGARGTAIEFHEDGRLEFVLADSFVGPVEALDVAAEMGTSGTVLGRWHICGPGELRMSGLRPMGLTVHTRTGAVPAAGEREGWIAAIQTAPWRWERSGERLILRGVMFGNAVELRLRGA